MPADEPEETSVGARPAAVVTPEPVARIDALTGLRMLAAGAVYASHLLVPKSFPKGVRVFCANGYNGVTLFFILSGFVLTWNYGERLGSHVSGRALRSFFVARVARIFPVYLFALLWIVAPVWFGHKRMPFIWYHVFAVQTWSGNLLNAYGYNAPGWSVGVELFLYACFPFLLLLLRPFRRDRRALAIVAIVSVAFTASLLTWALAAGRADLSALSGASAHRWLYRTPWTRLGDFVLGMVAAYLALLVPRGAPGWWGRAAQHFGWITIVALMTSSSVYNSAASYDLLYMIPMFALIIGLALNPSTWLARAISTKTMLLLGESSFAFYLFHRHLLDVLGIAKTTDAVPWALSAAVTTAMIVCLSVGVHVVVEIPSRRFLRRALDAPRRNG